MALTGILLYGGFQLIQLFSDKADCCGCGACEQICPKNAIVMQEDEYGFIYPHIDYDVCIECFSCKRVCGYQNYRVESVPSEAYAVCDHDNDRLMRSASGGAFAAIASYVLNNGGAVFGAAMVSCADKLSVQHIMIVTEADLCKLQGSKYVQSDIGSSYKDARNILKTGRVVLFSGTPCQIAGLRAFLGRDYDNLYTVDIICHGVPSRRMFQDYLDVLQEKINANIDQFAFRAKDAGWGLEGRYYYKCGEKNKSKRVYYRLSSFYNLFIESEIYRENCYSCNFANANRVSDITLGDYWGIEKEHPEILTENGGNLNEENGISCLIINSQKGKSLFESSKNSMISSESTFEQVQRNNGQLNAPSHKGENRDKIFSLYHPGRFKEVDDWYWRNLGKKKYYYKILAVAPRRLKKAIKKVVRA